MNPEAEIKLPITIAPEGGDTEEDIRRKFEEAEKEVYQIGIYQDGQIPF
jgi:hypothetical protein